MERITNLQEPMKAGRNTPPTSGHSCKEMLRALPEQAQHGPAPHPGKAWTIKNGQGMGGAVPKCHNWVHHHPKEARETGFAGSGLVELHPEKRALRPAGTQVGLTSEAESQYFSGPGGSSFRGPLLHNRSPHRPASFLPPMNNSVVIFTKAAQMLAEADTIQKAKELKSLAITAADWARRKGMGEAAIQHCKNYAMEAEHKMGEMLLATKRAKAPNPKPSKDRRLHDVTDDSPTLKELGLSKRESAEAQRLALLPAPVFEAIRNGKKSRVAAKREVQRQEAIEKAGKLPIGKFRVLYTDPPWNYGDQLTKEYGPTQFHYPAQTIKELCALPIRECTAPDAVLFLWVTSPLLEESFAVINAWGFTYKSSFVWDKVKHNMGHYNSVRHEFLLICTRGSCTPDNPKLFDSVQSVERTRHSAKPAEFREIIETLYPHGKRLELFAREKTKGWEVYGNEC